jgi:hypothetical protein
MPSGREAHEPNPVGKKTVCSCQGADHSNRALRVLEWNGVEILRSQPVFEHEGCHAAGGEPICDLAALEVRGQAEIGSPRGHDHGRSRAFPLLRNKDAERGQISWIRPRHLGRSAGPKLHGRDAEGGIDGRIRGRVYLGQRCRVHPEQAQNSDTQSFHQLVLPRSATILSL